MKRFSPSTSMLSSAAVVAGAAGVQPSSSPVLLADASVVVQQRRGRFYAPVTESGWNHFKKRFGSIRKTQMTWLYQTKSMDDKPKKETPNNNYWGKHRLFNPIPSRVGIVNKKVADWGYPERRPPPAGIRNSEEFFPHFFSKYFPDEECKLVVDSVLNNETNRPIFHFPMHLTKREIRNYLRNIYGLDNIVHVKTRNIKGRYYKNEVGSIKSLPDYKEVTVQLDAPVRVDFKQIKGTEDAADNKKLA